MRKVYNTEMYIVCMMDRLLCNLTTSNVTQQKSHPILADAIRQKGAVRDGLRQTGARSENMKHSKIKVKCCVAVLRNM